METQYFYVKIQIRKNLKEDNSL